MEVKKDSRRKPKPLLKAYKGKEVKKIGTVSPETIAKLPKSN